MSTYRERRLAKAERLRGWAEKREAKAEALHAQNEPYRGDIAFNTQPGHIPERARAIARTERAFEHTNKARSMASRADGIESQLGAAIYDDDPDACERLAERIAALESKREAMKAKNAAFRKAHRAELAAMSAYERSQAVPHQSYELSNLGGRITKDRQRLDVVRRQQARAERAESAGGVVIEERSSGYCVITFAEKPDRSVLDALRAAGFRWAKGSWVGRTEQVPAEVKDDTEGGS